MTKIKTLWAIRLPSTGELADYFCQTKREAKRIMREMFNEPGAWVEEIEVVEEGSERSE